MDGAAALVERLAGRLGAQLVETHISWVLLGDGLAYKVKKPVRLPFVDYSTVERRRHFCEEEVRLNAGLAAGLYLGVSRITGPQDAPAIDGDGPTLDYAVRMRRFPPGALFSEQLAAGSLALQAVDRFAHRLAAFHAAAPVVRPDAAPDPLLRERRALAALEGARPLLARHQEAGLRRWIQARCAALQPLWAARAAAGRVRDGHGDLHLANVVDLGGDVAAFDCIEFDPALRQLDVLEDAAFALMDFGARGRPDLGCRFINAWLDDTGDHDALPALPLAVVSRALVRAHVEQLRAPGSRAGAAYVREALDWSHPRAPRLAITHGLPGSGKTFASQRWLETVGGIRLRSDVERKRLSGLRALDDSRALGIDLYTADATRRTYARLFELARTALRAGFPAVLDAAFLRREERVQALAVARELGVPFSILSCEAPPAVLRERLRTRQADASEADEQVLERLSAVAEPLGPDELPFALRTGRHGGAATEPAGVAS